MLMAQVRPSLLTLAGDFLSKFQVAKPSKGQVAAYIGTLWSV